MKTLKLLFLCLLIGSLTLLPSIILSNSGTVCFDYSGFGMDSSGILYVGETEKIETYCGGEKIGTYFYPNSRSYAFTVQADDTILLSTGTKVYQLDLSASTLAQWDDEGTRTFNQLRSTRKDFTAPSGERYSVRWNFGRTSIYSENGTCIYKMPLLDYLMKLYFFGGIASLFILVPMILHSAKKEGFSCHVFS